MFLVLNEHRNNNLKTNFLFFFVSVHFVFTAVSELIFFFKTAVSFLLDSNFCRLLSFRTVFSELNFF